MEPKIKQTCRVIERTKTFDGSEVRLLKGEFNGSELYALELRARFNPDLEYYAVHQDSLTEEQTPHILNLIKNFGECSLCVKI